MISTDLSSGLAITAAEASSVAQALTSPADLERFVAELPAERVPAMLAGLLDAATNIRALTKGFEQRLAADGLTGQHFTVGSQEYAFFGAQQKGWKDLPGLYANLIGLGLSLADLAGATSEARVTDLRKAAAMLKDPQRQQEALDLIEQARVPKGERGSPTFKIVTEHLDRG